MISTFDRRLAILKKIELLEKVDFATLASQFLVSEMTIRRDIDFLAEEGKVQKVLGGAIASTVIGFEPAYQVRAEIASIEKANIASATVELIQKGETVIIDSGSTALAVARAICGKELSLTILTPSILVAIQLAGEPETVVILVGGEVRAGELSLIGKDTIDIFSRYNADTFIMGVAGINSVRGITDYHIGESSVKQAAMKSASKTFVVADDSKLDKIELAHVCSLSKVQAIITNGTLLSGTLAKARQMGIAVHCVPTGSPSLSRG